jgi:hypothetical protein
MIDQVLPFGLVAPAGDLADLAFAQERLCADQRSLESYGGAQELNLS